MNESSSNDVYNGLIVRPNEVAVQIMWYEMIDMSDPELKYKVLQDYPHSVVQNNEYLVMGGDEVNSGMHQILGDSNPVPKNRRTTRTTSAGRTFGAYARTLSDYQRDEETWHEKEYDNVWLMDGATREAALARRIC